MLKEEIIIVGSGIIDFYVKTSKYNSYKTEQGRKNYVYRELEKIFKSLVGEVISTSNTEPQIDLAPRITLRDVSITSNNYWGNEFTFINDLDYSCNNECKEIDDSKNLLPIRIFQIDIIGVTPPIQTKLFYHFKVVKPNFVLTNSSFKLV